jgi:hypothetical protein
MMEKLFQMAIKNEFRIKYLVVIVMCFIAFNTYAMPLWFPNESNSGFGGYIKDLPYLTISPNGDHTEFNNLIHARVNTAWFPFTFLRLEVGGRLQVYSGESFNGDTSQFIDQFGIDLGFADLTDVWVAILYLNIDRAWIGFQTGNLNIIGGRQRINWGTNLIWNPNDWFNTFNFIDFDYEERPGTDALLLQYYLSEVSVAELAIKFGQDQEDRTFAALYKFNMLNFDIQLQAGVFGLDGAAGISWAGSILDGGFRGEIAYFHPVFDTGVNNLIVNDTSGRVVAAISGDYTFENSLFLHLELLYNGFGTTGAIDSNERIRPDLNAKNLLPSRFGIFGEISFTFTSLLQATVASSMNPSDLSFYVAPSFTWSVFQNIDFFAIAQLFFGDENTLYGETSDLITVSARWNF